MFKGTTQRPTCDPSPGKGSLNTLTADIATSDANRTLLPWGGAGGGLLGGSLSFTLNRQFRTWPFSYGWQGDTLLLTCKQTTYSIPRSEVEHAKSFCWLSPQTDGVLHHDVRGTFCFISFDALRSLLSTGSFLYDSITWRLIDRTDSTLHVRADIDGTEMTIALPSSFAATLSQSNSQPSLPFVLEMRNNPLGIDWTLTLKPSAQK